MTTNWNVPIDFLIQPAIAYLFQGVGVNIDFNVNFAPVRCHAISGIECLRFRISQIGGNRSYAVPKHIDGQSDVKISRMNVAFEEAAGQMTLNTGKLVDQLW